MKGEWTKTIRVEFETTIGMTDCYVSADCLVSGWWDEGRLFGDNCYPPESGWNIESMEGQIEFYDMDGDITDIVEFTDGYSRQINAEIESAVEAELERVFS